MSTSIAWTDTTWNPTTGCDRISQGCDHCYALTLAKRLKAMGQAKYQNDGDPRTSGPGFKLTVHPGALDLPLHWRDPRLVFVNSMSDLFHARVPVEFTARVWATMARTPQHTYQILTKRPDRMRRVVGDDIDGPQRLLETLGENDAAVLYGEPWPLPNVWLGASVEHAETVHRLDDLRQVSAAVKFLSLEPLLGPLPDLELDGIDWIIIGGESGSGARPMEMDWALDLLAQAEAAGVPAFFKQTGSVLARKLGLSGKGEDWGQLPEELQVREWPKQAVAQDA